MAQGIALPHESLQVARLHGSVMLLSVLFRCSAPKFAPDVLHQLTMIIMRQPDVLQPDVLHQLTLSPESGVWSAT